MKKIKIVDEGDSITYRIINMFRSGATPKMIYEKLNGALPKISIDRTINYFCKERFKIK